MTLWAGYWIYALSEPKIQVLGPVSYVLWGVGVVGILILLLGARSGVESAPKLTQRGGRNSINIQSGRDANVNQEIDRG